jgi:hypothetical protein
MRAAPDFPRVTDNCRLLMGWVVGHLFGKTPYACIGLDAERAELTLEHRRNGNTYRIRVEQIAGTEFAPEATDAPR